MPDFVMDSFRFNKSFCEALDTMDDEQAGELVKALAHKVFYNRDPDGFFGTRPTRPLEPQP